MDGEIFFSDGIIDNLAEFAMFFGFDLEAEEVEVEFEDLFDFDDVGGGDELIDAIDNHTEFGIFADRVSVDEVRGVMGEGAAEAEGDDF